MNTFTIFYSDKTISGATEADWRAMPSEDVQVIVEWRTPDQMKGEWKWTGVTDRFLWTGEDEYDPFGWGIKYGKWMTHEDYIKIWEIAAYASDPVR